MKFLSWLFAKDASIFGKPSLRDFSDKELKYWQNENESLDRFELLALTSEAVRRMLDKEATK